MARRLVSVQLELLANQYLREGRLVLATTTTTTRAVEDLGDKVDATSRDMLQLATTTEVAKRQVDDLGDEARGTARDLGLLQARIDATRLHVRQMGADFAASGDLGLLGDIGQERAFLAKLEKLLKEMKGPKQPPAPPSIFAAIPSIGGVPGPVVAGIGAGVAALSPFLGGVIAAAVLGGVGTGGLIGGIILAAKDTRVQDAWKQLGNEVFVNIGDAASPLVQPLIGAASTFGDAWRKELPGVQRDFQILAKAVDPLAKGTAGFVRNLHPGLTTAFKASIPLAEQFGKEFAGFGTDLGEFFRDMARAAPGAKVALHDLFTVIGGGLDMLGDGTKILSGTYEGMRKLGLVAPPEWLMQASQGALPTALELLNPELEKSVNNLKNAYTPTQELARAQEDAADAAKHQADALDKLNKRVDDYYDAILKPFDANERWHRSLLDLDDALKENGRTLDIHTRQGLANRDAIEEQFAATKARLDAGTLTEQQYQREIDKLALLGTKFRDTTGFVDALVEAYRKTPTEIRTTLSVMAEGSGLSILLRLLKATATGRIPLTMGEHSGGQIKQITGSTTGLPGPGHGAFIEGLAGGGDVMAGRPVVVGDGGRPEVFVPWANGTVFPSTQSYAAAAGIVRHVIDLQLNGRTVRTLAIDEALSRGVSETTIELAYP